MPPALLAGAIVGASALATGATVAAAIVRFAVTSVLSAVGNALSPKPKARANTGEQGTRLDLVSDPTFTRRIVYGEAALGGSLAFFESFGDANEFLSLVIPLADAGPIDSFGAFAVDNEPVTFDAAGTVIESRFRDAEGNPLMWKFDHTGAEDQAADPALDAVSAKWTADHRLRGVAYYHWKLKFDREKFPTGLPKPRQVIRGRRLYDPRLDSTVAGGSGPHRIDDPASWAWSRNPALCLYDYLRGIRVNGVLVGGVGIPSADIDVQSVIVAANICDEPVPLKAGGVIARYTANGVVDTGVKHRTTLERLLSAMDGRLVQRGAVFHIFAGAPAIATASLGDDDLRGAIEVNPRVSRNELVNAVVGTYVEPAADWQPVDYPPRTSSAYEAEDGGERFVLDMDFPFTTSGPTAQRLAKIALERARRQTAVKFPAKLSALGIEAWDTVLVTNGDFGWQDKKFRVTDWALSSDLGVDLVLQEEDDAIYDWTPATDEQATDTPPPLTVNPGTTVTTPQNVTLAPVSFTGSDGTVSAGLRVTWDEPTDPFIRASQVQIRQLGDTEWRPAGGLDGRGASLDIFALEPNTSYEVRVRNLGGAGLAIVPSAWSATAAGATGPDQAVKTVIDGAITTQKLADGATTTEKLADGATVAEVNAIPADQIVTGGLGGTSPVVAAMVNIATDEANRKVTLDMTARMELAEQDIANLNPAQQIAMQVERDGTPVGLSAASPFASGGLPPGTVIEIPMTFSEIVPLAATASYTIKAVVNVEDPLMVSDARAEVTGILLSASFAKK